MTDYRFVRPKIDFVFLFFLLLFFLIKIIFYISLSELLPPAASLNSRGRARSKNNSRTIMASGSDGDVSRSLKTPETLNTSFNMLLLYTVMKWRKRFKYIFHF